MENKSNFHCSNFFLLYNALLGPQSLHCLSSSLISSLLIKNFISIRNVITKKRTNHVRRLNLYPFIYQRLFLYKLYTLLYLIYQFSEFILYELKIVYTSIAVYEVSWQAVQLAHIKDVRAVIQSGLPFYED